MENSDAFLRSQENWLDIFVVEAARLSEAQKSETLADLSHRINLLHRDLADVRKIAAPEPSQRVMRNSPTEAQDMMKLAWSRSCGQGVRFVKEDLVDELASRTPKRTAVPILHHFLSG